MKMCELSMDETGLTRKSLYERSVVCMNEVLFV